MHLEERVQKVLYLKTTHIFMIYNSKTARQKNQKKPKKPHNTQLLLNIL